MPGAMMLMRMFDLDVHRFIPRRHTRIGIST
jgi:hypothetical protein